MLYSHKLLAGTLAFVLITGFATPAFAGISADQNPPTFRGNDCSAIFQFFSVGDPGELQNAEDCPAGELSDFPLHQRCEEIRPVTGNTPNIVVGLACHMEMPNFDDGLDTKLIRFQVTYEGVEPIINNVKPKNGEDCEQIGFGNSPNYFFADYICHPNPDNDRIWLELQPGTVILDAIVDTWSFDEEEPVVGGEFLPIDSTALILAGAQTNAVWILSALAVIGSVAFGALYITTKKN